VVTRYSETLQLTTVSIERDDVEVMWMGGVKRKSVELPLNDEEYEQLSDKFEEIENEMFGSDGFESALKRMEEIEASLGLTGLDMFTAPPPPK